MESIIVVGLNDHTTLSKMLDRKASIIWSQES